MRERLVVSPEHGAAWFYSACPTDALVQAATEWNCSFAELLDGYRNGTVKVLRKKEST